jgi:glycerophosphoryl diester phosphodiesterase
MSELLAIAHRAGNSLAGLRAATELGADVIECDVNHSGGRLEVHHLKTMGPLPFLWDLWELRSARTPQLGLAELLTAAREGTTFMLDLKGSSPAVGAAVVETLHEHAPGRPVMVCTRHWPALEPFRGVEWVRPVRSARTRSEFSALKQSIEDDAPHGVSVHLSLLDAATVAELHDRVEVVMTWPVNTPAALSKVSSWAGSGKVGVISDELPVLRQLLSTR